MLNIQNSSTLPFNCPCASACLLRLKLLLLLLTVRAEDKFAALLWLVREALPPGQLTIVFASTRHHVEFLHQLLTREGVQAACVYGSMDQVRGVGCG